MRNRISVLNIPIDSVTMDEAVSLCEEFIRSGKKNHVVATANAEMVMMAQEDRELADTLLQADLVVPDGAGVVWAARHQGNLMPERVAGFDLVQQLLKLSAQKSYKVYMFGGAPGIVEQAKRKAEDLYRGLQVVGVRNGYFSPSDENAIITELQNLRPDILLVALGVPKQEKWIIRNRAKLNVPLAIGVGGTFDVMAGAVKRAPLWMQRANLEWLYRLLSQPQRAIRMLALPRFVLRVFIGKSIRQK